MNQLILLGNVGNDAETHQFDNNKYAIRFNIAVTENWKDNQGVKQSKTDWFRCVRYATSPNLANYIKKGTKLLVTEKAAAEAYLKDGQAVAVAICNVRDIQFIDSPNNQKEAGAPNTNLKQETPQGNEGFDDENDLPF